MENGSGESKRSIKPPLKDTMDELTKIFLTSALTIIGGIIIYVVGQILSKFFIDPIHKQGEIIGEISDTLVYYAREYLSPGRLQREMLDQAHDRLRKLASLLKARSYMVKWYSLFVFLGWVPKLKSIEEASTHLISLSNSVYRDSSSSGIRNADSANKVRGLLGIPETD